MSFYGYFDGDELVGACLVQTPDAKLSIRAGLGADVVGRCPIANSPITFAAISKEST